MRTSTLDEIGDLSAPKGSKEWCLAVAIEAESTLRSYHSDAKHAGQWLNALREQKAWKKLGLMSWSAFLFARFDITEDQADALISSKRGDKTGAVLAVSAEVEKLPGAGRPEVAENNFDNVKINSGQGGNDLTYTLRRLKRDAPELFEQVKSGELSANAAAIKAGFRTKSVTVPIDVERAARAIKKHFTNKQIHELMERLA